MRSQSGILEVALLTSPWDMEGKNNGCDWDCYYCPNQEGMPRSYIRNEPAVLRAEKNGFSPMLQIYDRLSTYDVNGHYINKLEIIVLGGTWSSYSHNYQKEFIRDVYYAANTYFDINKREKYSLFEEQTINTKALCKIVGLTLETRPDCINEEEITRFLEYGVTRVQIGIQTTDEYILKKINRGCNNADAIRALRLLKDAGLKVLIHLMPNLPFSTPENDKEMFKTILNYENRDKNGSFIADEIKIYPTSVTTTSDKDNTEVTTVIEKWFNDGKYVPYSNEELFELLVWVKERIQPYIRLTRIFRDIPVANICGGANIPNMREELKKMLKTPCRCIRCREVKNIKVEPKDIKYNTRRIISSESVEYFLSYESKTKEDKLLHGFLRLRFPKTKNYTFVRELHVYGTVAPTYIKKNKSNNQHKGLGKSLLKSAEWITYLLCYDKILINSGVGVRDYYKKLGYKLNKDNYMEKQFTINCREIYMSMVVLCLSLVLLCKAIYIK
tara:strand:- start:1969 stop:3468 length:1500 start_codon:yes stop_codon:yes gene_type:complete